MYVSCLVACSPNKHTYIRFFFFMCLCIRRVVLNLYFLCVFELCAKSPINKYLGHCRESFETENMLQGEIACC